MNGGVGTPHVGVSCSGKELRGMSLGVQHQREVAPCCPCPPKKGAQHAGREEGCYTGNAEDLSRGWVGLWDVQQ